MLKITATTLLNLLLSATAAAIGPNLALCFLRAPLEYRRVNLNFNISFYTWDRARSGLCALGGGLNV